jgi:type II secretory pathway component PulF
LATARAARALGALLRVGTPALAALDIARLAAGNAGVAARITRARERVAEGAGLSAALTASEALTATALQLAGIGEASGALPDLLERAAYLEETLAERRTKALVSLLEPALILAFAAVVAFVAAALLQALYSLRPGSV